MGLPIGELVVLVAGVSGIFYAWVNDRGAKVAARVMGYADWLVSEMDAEIAEWRAAELRMNAALAHARDTVNQHVHYRHFGDLWLDVAVGDEVQVFKCAGCDEVKWRGEDGYLKVCDGVEFCSAECRKDPRPFDHTQVGGYLSLN